MDIWEGVLKEAGAKTAFQTEGEYKAAALDSMRELMCCLNITDCKPISVTPKIKLGN